MTGTSAANLRGCLRTGLGCTDQELDLSWLCGVFVGTKKKSAAWADSVRSQKSGLGVSSCSQLSLLPIGRGFYVVLYAVVLIRGFGVGHDVFPSREVPAGKLGVGLGVGRCRENHGFIRWLFCPYVY